MNNKKFECILGFHTYEIRLIGKRPTYPSKRMTYVSYRVIEYCSICGHVKRSSLSYSCLSYVKRVFKKVKYLYKKRPTMMHILYNAPDDKLPKGYDLLPDDFKHGRLIKCSK